MEPADVVEETSAGGIVVHTPVGEVPLYLIIRDSYRNWGFPKGHIKQGEAAGEAALREVREETGLDALQLTATLHSIDWHFRFRGRLIHKLCHFFLMQSGNMQTSPQRDEGITACRWEPYDRAVELVSYANAREVLRSAHGVISGGSQPTP